MKKVIVIICIMFSVTSFSQSQVTFDIVKAIVAASAQETITLVSVSDDQNDVKKYTEDILFKTASTIIMKNEYYNSLRYLEKNIPEYQFYKDVVQISKDIYDKMLELIEISKYRPESYLFSTNAQIQIYKEVGYWISDLKLAIKESDTNLISMVDRLEILETVKINLVRLKNLVDDLINVLLMSKAVDTFDIFGLSIDIEKIYTDMENEYQKMFPENLKDY